MKENDVTTHTGFLFPPSDVYTILTDYEGTGEWLPETFQFHYRESGGAPTISFRCQPFILTGAIQQENPAERVLIRLDNSQLTGFCEWKLKPGDMGTALAFTLQAKIRSVVHQGLSLIRNYEYLIRNDCRRYFTALTKELERRSLTGEF